MNQFLDHSWFYPCQWMCSKWPSSVDVAVQLMKTNKWPILRLKHHKTIDICVTSSTIS